MTQMGFTSTALLLVTLIIVGIGGGVFYSLTDNNTNPESTINGPKSLQEQSLENSLEVELSQTEEVNNRFPSIDTYTSAALFGDIVEIRGSGFDTPTATVSLFRTSESGSNKDRILIEAESTENTATFTVPREGKNVFGETIEITPGLYFMQMKISDRAFSYGVSLPISDTIEFNFWAPEKVADKWVIGESHVLKWSDNLNTHSDATKYNLYLVGNLRKRIGTIATGATGSSYIWKVGEFEEDNIVIQPGTFWFEIEKKESPYPVSSLGNGPIEFISANEERVVVADVKIDGSDFISTRRNEILEVSWTSENAEGCTIGGSHIPAIGGGTLAGGYNDIGKDGSKKIYARHSNSSDITELNITLSCVGLRSDGKTPITVFDSAKIYIQN